MIRPIGDRDADAILEIYRRGLDTGEASFETEPPDWPTWQHKYHPFCRLGFEQSGVLLGWAALAAVSARDCYRGVAEVSIYVDPDRLIVIPASEIREDFDWAGLLERLCGPPSVSDPVPKPVTFAPTLWD